MGQREIARRQRRRRRRRRHAAVVHQPRIPGDHRNDRHQHREPQRGQRDGDAACAIAHEPHRPEPFAGHPREQAGNQEEQQHPEHVRHVEQQAGERARRCVMGDPEVLRPRNPGHAGVHDQAEQQGDAAHGIQSVQAFAGWVGKRGLHRVLRCSGCARPCRTRWRATGRGSWVEAGNAAQKKAGRRDRRAQAAGAVTPARSVPGRRRPAGCGGSRPRHRPCAPADRVPRAYRVPTTTRSPMSRRCRSPG